MYLDIWNSSALQDVIIFHLWSYVTEHVAQKIIKNLDANYDM